MALFKRVIGPSLNPLENFLFSRVVPLLLPLDGSTWGVAGLAAPVAMVVGGIGEVAGEHPRACAPACDSSVWLEVG